MMGQRRRPPPPPRSAVSSVIALMVGCWLAGRCFLVGPGVSTAGAGRGGTVTSTAASSRFTSSSPSSFRLSSPDDSRGSQKGFGQSRSSTAFAFTAIGLSAVVCRAAASKKKRKKGVRVVEGKEIPWNIFGPKAPYKATVVDNHRHPQTLTQPSGDPNWETCHLTIDHGGNLPYIEGQSIGLIPPGPDKKGENPAKLRLYSIASSATGDDETSTTVSLCVKRLVEVEGKHVNRSMGQDLPDKAGTAYPDKEVYRGVASNYVCNLNPGDEVLITGPTGAEMLLPDDPEANLIMLATGTGIAPMRSYCRLLFHDRAGANPDGSRKFKGKVWLFCGVPYGSSLLYDEEHREYKSQFPEQFRYDYAVSREDLNSAGEKMYIQTKMAEYADELWALMQDPKTHVYMCGLKGMEKGMQECFGPIAERHGLDWADFAKGMKKSKRYHVEVY